MFLIQKENLHGDNIFLVDTYGYGPAWTRSEDDAWVFKSLISAARVKNDLLINSAEIIRA